MNAAAGKSALTDPAGSDSASQAPSDAGTSSAATSPSGDAGQASGSDPSFTPGGMMESTFLKLVKEDKFGTIGKDPEKAKQLASSTCGSLKAAGGTWSGAEKKLTDEVSGLTKEQARSFVSLSVTSLCPDQTSKIGS